MSLDKGSNDSFVLYLKLVLINPSSGFTSDPLGYLIVKERTLIPRTSTVMLMARDLFSNILKCLKKESVPTTLGTP